MASSLFSSCPRCRQNTIHQRSAKEHACHACGFVFFQNTAAAAGVIIEWAGQVLFTVRLHEPAKDCLALPGGFIDNGESAEDGVCRETREELGLEVPPGELRYLVSFPNQYPFLGIVYYTLDLFFYWHPAVKPAAVAGDEVAAVCWLARSEVPLEKLAFVSSRQALAHYLHVVLPRVSGH